MLPGGSSDTTGAPAGTHSPCTNSVSWTSAVLRRALRLLREPPVGLRERGARGRDLGLGGADLVGAGGEPRGRRAARASRRPAPRARAAWLRASSSALGRNVVGAVELLLAPEVRLGELEVRLRLGELGAHRLDLARPLRLLQVVELRLRARERGRPPRAAAPPRCPARGRTAASAALTWSPRFTGELGELPGERRGDADVLALGVALEALLRRIAAAGGELPRGGSRLRAAPSGVRRAASARLAVALGELLQREPGRVEAPLHRAVEHAAHERHREAAEALLVDQARARGIERSRRRSAARPRRARAGARATAARAAGGR